MNTDMTGKQAFRIIFGALVAYLLFCQFGCASTAHAIANPIETIKGWFGHDLKEGPPDYGWMWQVLAIGGIIFAVASSWIAGHVTRGSLLIAGTSIGASWWGASLDTIQKTTAWVIPVVVVAFLIWGAIDVYFRIRKRYFRKGA